MADKKNAPVAKVQISTVQGAAWKRETDKGNFYSATFTNRYKDKEQKWQDGDSYSHMDLLALAEAARQLFGDIQQLREEDRAAGRPQTEPGSDG